MYIDRSPQGRSQAGALYTLDAVGKGENWPDSPGFRAFRRHPPPGYAGNGRGPPDCL